MLKKWHISVMLALGVLAAALLLAVLVHWRGSFYPVFMEPSQVVSIEITDGDSGEATVLTGDETVREIAAALSQVKVRATGTGWDGDCAYWTVTLLDEGEEENTLLLTPEGQVGQDGVRYEVALGLEQAQTAAALIVQAMEHQSLYVASTSGLRQVDRDGTVTLLSEEMSAVYAGDAVWAVFVQENEQGQNDEDAVWGVTWNGQVIYQEQLVYDGDALLRPQQSVVPTDQSTAWVDSTLYFIMYLRDENCNRLCSIDADGENFQRYDGFDVCQQSLRTDGTELYFLQNGGSVFLPSKLDRETGQAEVLSEVTANIGGGYWVDGGQLWWLSLTEDAGYLYTVPTSGGDTRIQCMVDTTVLTAYFVAGGRILEAQNGTLVATDIGTLEVQTYSVPFLPQGGVVAAASWGALLYDDTEAERAVWLLDYGTGTLRNITEDWT